MRTSSSPALGGSLSQALASPKALGLCLWLMLARMEPNPIGEHRLQLLGPLLRCLVHVAHRLKALLGARLHPDLLCAWHTVEVVQLVSAVVSSSRPAQPCWKVHVGPALPPVPKKLTPTLPA